MSDFFSWATNGPFWRLIVALAIVAATGAALNGLIAYGCALVVLP